MARRIEDINGLLSKLTSGTISPEEKIILEQIAQEDPFVKDAMDGYLKLKKDQSKSLKELGNLVQEKGRQKRSSNRYL